MGGKGGSGLNLLRPGLFCGEVAEVYGQKRCSRTQQMSLTWEHAGSTAGQGIKFAVDNAPCQDYGLYSGEGQAVKKGAPFEVVPQNWRLEAKTDRVRTRQAWASRGSEGPDRGQTGRR